MGKHVEVSSKELRAILGFAVKQHVRNIHEGINSEDTVIYIKKDN